MSKYIDLNEATDLFKGIDATMTGGWVADTLEALPTIEVNEDCTSKAYLEQEIENHLLSTENLRTEKDEWWNKAFEVMVELIEDAPSVLPSREEGEWKWKSGDVCDNCGYEIPHLERIVGDVVLMDSKDWSYCPNCGSRRKGVRND